MSEENKSLADVLDTLADNYDEYSGYLEAHPHFRLAAARIREMEQNNSRLLAYLGEIIQGAGPYSRDPLEHADNCINAMKQLAVDAIRGKPFGDET